MRKYKIPTLISLYKLRDPVWIKVVTLAATLLFVFLADAVLSFWVPVFLNGVYEDETMVGLVMSFSSLVGLFADLTLPQLLKGVTVRALVILGIISSFIFSFFLVQSTITPILFLILSAMAIWGIYYELLGFAQQQFVADSTPLRLHPGAWGVLGVFKSSAYFIGPLIGGTVIKTGIKNPLYIAMVFICIGFLFLIMNKSKHKRSLNIELEKVNIAGEFGHWVTLFVHVWPILILSLMLGLVDAYFWTIGPIWMERIAKDNFLGDLLLSFYVFPFLFMGFVIARWGIYKGKKRLAIKLAFTAGIILFSLSFTQNIVVVSLIIIASSAAIAAAYPLIDGVYSDIVTRMGRERGHMIGLSNSTRSVAYIIGPASAGFLSSMLGEKSTFSAIGLLVILVSGILMLTTPKKLKLPQSEIKEWKD